MFEVEGNMDSVCSSYSLAINRCHKMKRISYVGLCPGTADLLQWVTQTLSLSHRVGPLLLLGFHRPDLVGQLQVG